MKRSKSKFQIKFASVLPAACLFAFACNYSVVEKDRDTVRFTTLDVAVLLCFISGPCATAVTSAPPVEPHDCSSYSGAFNTLYYARPVFWEDTTQYQNIIIGDSTMDFSVNYEFLKDDPLLATNYEIPADYDFYDNVNTQSVAVSGNTLCDMIMQMGAINTANPTNIIVSTAGGNDIGRRISNDNVITSGKAFIDKVKGRFPESRLVMVGLHPTLVDYGNQNKATTNSAIRDYLLTKDNTCWVDPLSLFGVAEGSAANTADLIDTIHYKPAISISLKQKIKTDCAVEF